jgi:mannosyl-oligosaccharide alpha-1,2-mannosidase
MRADGSPSLLRAMPALYGSTKSSRRRARRHVILPIVTFAACFFLFSLFRETAVIRDATLGADDATRPGVRRERPLGVGATSRAHAGDAASERLAEIRRVSSETKPGNDPSVRDGEVSVSVSNDDDDDDDDGATRVKPGGEDARSGYVPDGGWVTVAADPERREAVKRAMVSAYDSYEKYAFGADELEPLSKRGRNAFGGLGATIVDSLDTLWIMGLTEHYARARDWVVAALDFDRDWDASVFETTIRVLGGLLAAYDLSGDPAFLEKCLDVAARLEPAFDTPTRVPVNIVNLRTGRAKTPPWTGNPGVVVLAEFGSLGMEFGALSERSGEDKWRVLGETPVKVAIERSGPESLPPGVPAGLYPLFFDSKDARWTNSKVSIGAMGDSWYEYLLKVWVQGGRTEQMLGWRQAWERAADAVIAHLLVTSPSDDSAAFVAGWSGGGRTQEMDHLSCFAGGMFALGSGSGSTERERLYLETAKKITKACYSMYEDSPTGVAPETVDFRGGAFRAGQRQNIQRPEAIESLFYLYRKTGDSAYRDWAWEIFQSMEKHFKTESGWTGLRDVQIDPPEHDDVTQSFFFAETLKYLYLIFCDSDVVHLDEWVFNTEAHPLRVRARTKSEVSPRRRADE